MLRLIVGLANPGKQYQDTRHNAGAWYVASLCGLHQGKLNSKKEFHGACTTVDIAERHRTHVLIPETFMNHSGRSVNALVRYYKILPHELLVVHDELDFAPGTVRFKRGGSAGGHNGLKDIIQCIGSQDFWRLRIGIGHPGTKEEVARYVLNSPSNKELKSILTGIQSALDALPVFARGETEQAMHLLHTEG